MSLSDFASGVLVKDFLCCRVWSHCVLWLSWLMWKLQYCVCFPLCSGWHVILLSKHAFLFSSSASVNSSIYVLSFDYGSNLDPSDCCNRAISLIYHLCEWASHMRLRSLACRGFFVNVCKVKGLSQRLLLNVRKYAQLLDINLDTVDINSPKCWGLCTECQAMHSNAWLRCDTPCRPAVSLQAVWKAG